jgi:hypothetical protein
MSEYLIERLDVSFIVVKASSKEEALEIANVSIDGWDIDIGNLTVKELECAKNVSS